MEVPITELPILLPSKEMKTDYSHKNVPLLPFFLPATATILRLPMGQTSRECRFPTLRILKDKKA
jgi:hypothetical protein